MADVKTGEIFMSEDDVRKIVGAHHDRASDIVRIPHALAQRMMRMSRRQRRDYFRKHKKEFRGLKWAELSKL